MVDNTTGPKPQSFDPALGPWLTRIRIRSSELRDYAHNTAVEIALSCLGVISGVLLARWLGPAGRGQLSAAVMWPTVSATTIALGLPNAFAYAMGVRWANPEHLSRLALKFTMLVAVPAMVIYWFVCPWILRRQFPDQTWIPRVFAIFIPLTVYVGLLFPIYQGSGDFTRWNIGRLFRNGAWTFCIITLAVVAGLSVLNLLLVQMAILAVVGIYLFSQLSRLSKHDGSQEAAWEKLIFRYGGAIYISSIAYTVNQQLDQLLLSLWVAPSELGQYAAAATLANVIFLIPSALGPIAFSKIARARAGSLRQHYHVQVALIFTVTLLLPAGLLLGILSPVVTALLYGSSYVQAAQLLRVLAPGTVFLGTAYTMSEILRAAGQPMYAGYGTFAGAAMTVAGLCWALPRFGIWGAAWVSFVAYAAMMLLQGYFLWRWFSANLLPRRPVKTN